MAANSRSAKTIANGGFALLALAFSAADAKARPDVTEMSCNEARELVFRQGAIVMTTGERTFERFVESQRFCQPVDEISVPAIVVTRDNPQCWVGYVCRNRADLISNR